MLETSKLHKTESCLVSRLTGYRELRLLGCVTLDFPPAEASIRLMRLMLGTENVVFILFVLEQTEDGAR